MSFQPTQIPGCVLWLDGTDPAGTGIAPANGDSISTWADKSGNGNNGTAGTAPSFNSSGIGGKGVVSFNGSTTFLNSQDLYSGRSFSIFVVIRRQASITTQTAFMNGSEGIANRNLHLGWRNNTELFLGFWANDLNFTSFPTYTGNTSTEPAYILTYTYTPGTRLIAVDGLTSAQDTNSTNLISDVGARIGGGGSGAGVSFDGFLGEIIVLNGVPVLSQRQQVEGYLAWKWGLQDSLPPTHPYKNFPPTSLLIQQSTEVTLVNTSAVSGTITLPSVSSLQGRILTFKDVQGTWGQNPLTLSTAGILDKFEDGTNLKTFQNLWGATTLYGGTNNRWFIIGGSQYAYGTTNQITTSTIQASAFYGNQFPVGAITFQNSFSPLNLSNSLLLYGSTILGPTTNRQGFFLRSLASSFSPRQISPLRMWYDASDLNTVVITGDTVTRWNDKSGNNNNAVSPVGTIRFNQSFYNGYSLVTFNPASYFTYTVNYTGTRKAFFAVITAGPRTGTAIQHTGIDGGNSGTSLQFYSINLGLQFSRRGANILVASNTPSFFNATTIISAANASGTGRGIFVNGIAQTLTTNLANLFTTGNANVRLGGGTTNTQTTSLGEVLVYELDISQVQRQQVEGYLAWKWGLVGELPSDHPYKNIQP
jgi:hypothetical protein